MPESKEQGQKQTSPADATAGQQTPTKSPREQELETRLSEQGQENARLRQELELLQPYVNFQGPANQPQVAADFDPDDPTAVLQHNLQAEIHKIQANTDAKLKAMEFLGDHPDLKPHRDRLAYVLANRTDKRKTIDARLADAGRLVQEEIAQIKKQGVDEHTVSSQAQAQQEAQAEGVMSGHQQAPGSESEETGEGGETNEEYLASRQQFHNDLLGGTGTTQ